MDRKRYSLKPGTDMSAISFDDEAQDTEENREVAVLVQQRGTSSRGDASLDELIVELGHEPIDFVPR